MSETAGNASEDEPLSIVRQLNDKVFELSNGDFVFIGTDQTEAFDPQLGGFEAARADYERTVVIGREALTTIRDQLPDA